jgi:hypothetical protein
MHLCRISTLVFRASRPTMVLKEPKVHRVCKGVLEFKDLVEQLVPKVLVALTELTAHKVCRAVQVHKVLMAITEHKEHKELVVHKVFKGHQAQVVHKELVVHKVPLQTTVHKALKEYRDLVVQRAHKVHKDILVCKEQQVPKVHEV